MHAGETRGLAESQHGCPGLHAGEGNQAPAKSNFRPNAQGGNQGQNLRGIPRGPRICNSSTDLPCSSERGRTGQQPLEEVASLHRSSLSQNLRPQKDILANGTCKGETPFCMVAPNPNLSPEGRQRLKQALKQLKKADAPAARLHLDVLLRLHPQCVEAWLLRGLLSALSSGDAECADLARAAELSGISLTRLQSSVTQLARSRPGTASALTELPRLAAALAEPEAAVTVPEPFWRGLMGAFEACHGRSGAWQPFVAPALLSRAAATFKLDVSFVSGPGRHARFSVNDKMEPVAFRERLKRHVTVLGCQPQALRDFFAVAAPGEVQTTVGVKYLDGSATPDRVSLYYEELSQSDRSSEIRASTFGLLGLQPPPLADGYVPNAVCIDYRNGVAVGAKCYDVTLERRGSTPAPLPSCLNEVRTRLPWHPVMNTRRYMRVHRVDAGGADAGCKLLFMTEVHDPAHSRSAFALAASLLEQYGPVNAAVQGAFDELSLATATATHHYYYPDLIGLNVDAAGRAESAVAHVSVR